MHQGSLLHWACFFGHVAITNVLLNQFNAKMNVRSVSYSEEFNDLTPIEWAEKKGFFDDVNALFEERKEKIKDMPEVEEIETPLPEVIPMEDSTSSENILPDPQPEMDSKYIELLEKKTEDQNKKIQEQYEKIALLEEQFKTADPSSDDEEDPKITFEKAAVLTSCQFITDQLDEYSKTRTNSPSSLANINLSLELIEKLKIVETFQELYSNLFYGKNKNLEISYLYESTSSQLAVLVDKLLDIVVSNAKMFEIKLDTELDVFFPDVTNENRVEGWLVKRGGEIKTWHRRWFTLINGEMAYRKKKTSNILNIFNINGSQVKISDEFKKSEFGFQIDTGNRIFYCYASDKEQLDYWIDQLVQQGATIYQQ